MEVISGLESDLEEVKALMRSSSTAYASAAKALVRLRSAREDYITLLEAAKAAPSSSPSSPTSSECQSSDLLSPFLLLLSHKDVPTTGVCASLSGVQRLAQAGLLTPADGENICNMLDQLLGRRDQIIDTKLLQTCTVMAIVPGGGGGGGGMLNLDVCGKLVILCSRIADEDRTKTSGVRNTAIACLTQITTVVLERASKASWGDELLIAASTLVEELCAVPQRNEAASGTKAGFLRHVSLFASSLTGGGSSSSSASGAAAAAASAMPGSPSKPPSSARSDMWIEPNKLTNKDALEVLDTVLALVDKHFSLRQSMSSLVCDRVGPLVVALLRGKFREQRGGGAHPDSSASASSSASSSSSGGSGGGYAFAFHVRLMRLTRSLMSLGNTPVELVRSCLEEMLLVLESSSEIVLTPIWQYVLTLEALLSAFEHIRLWLFSDLLLVKRTMDALCRLMRLEPVEEEQEQVFWSSQYKSRGLELLSDTEPPAIICQPVLVVLISLECLVVVLADGMLGEEMIRVGLLLKRPSAAPRAGSAAAASSSSSAGLELGEVHRQVLELCWRPCLAALAALLAACQEETAVQYLLRAYLSITTSCGRVGLVEARDAFISNMCEVALPVQIATTNHARLLNRKHLQVLKTLFNVAHGLGEMLGTSWHIVLETFEELDFVLHVQKSNLLGGGGGGSISGVGSSGSGGEEDGDGSGGGLAAVQIEDEIDAETGMINSMLNNLFSTSTFLTDDAVLHLVIALSSMIFTNVSTAITSSHNSTTNSNGTPRQPHRASSSSSNNSSSAPSAYAPRKLMESLTNAVKAAISVPPGSPAATATATAQNGMAPPSMLPTVDVHDVRFPPFCFEKMLETAELNLGRIAVIWDVVGTTLLTLASEAEAEPRIRQFAVKSTEKLVTKIVLAAGNNTNNGNNGGNGMGVVVIDRQLRLDVVKRFTLLIRSPQQDTREFALQALYRFVSSAGYKLDGLWNLLVAELLIVSLQPSKTTSALAFKVVQLIMDDYRPSLDMGCLPSLALCLRAFGEQQNDVNMALTSVHHLWLLCEKGDESLVFEGDQLVPTADSLAVANALWMHVFDQLRLLSLDPRMEVRNSALRSLCTNIVQCSDRLTLASWRNCSLSIMLPLIGEIDAKAFNANSDHQLMGERLSQHSDQRMTVHHTQDTEEKQWRETRITALQGASKLVCTLMTKVPAYRTALADWFDVVWERVVHHHVERTLASNSPAKQVVAGAVSVLEELSLLVCGAKFRTKYALPGMKVENGALTGGGGSSSTSPPPSTSLSVAGVIDTQHTWLWDSLLQVFARLGDISPPPFDANVATLLVGVMVELFDDRDIQIVRTKVSLDVLLGCCARWTTHFSTFNSSATAGSAAAPQKKKNHFISPLERNVIKLLASVPPISWAEEGAVWREAVLPHLEQLDLVQQDEFHLKLHGAYLDSLRLAPDGVKSNQLKSALLAAQRERQARAVRAAAAAAAEEEEEEEHDEEEVEEEEKQRFRVDEVLFLGLEALDLAKDVSVWWDVFDLATTTTTPASSQGGGGDALVLGVLLDRGLDLLAMGRVPLEVKSHLLQRLREETVLSQDFALKVGMVRRFMRYVGNDNEQLSADVFPSFLVCASQLLMTMHAPAEEHEQQTLVDVLGDLFVLETPPQASSSSFLQPHLVQLIPAVEHLALHATSLAVRELAIRKLAWLALRGWQQHHNV